MDFFDTAMLSRLQFAVAVFFHFIFVPLTLGLSVLIAVMETIYVTTGNEQYKRMAKYWGRLFLINFALGVVTGITLEFQFGTNWSRYSEYVGDIFGPILAIEATLAFFLESTFIAVWHFGWDKISKGLHCVAIWLVAIASNLSAVWIIIANGFMQNPLGYWINPASNRAELTNFWEVVTNPYAWGIFFHVIVAAWMLAGFFVLGISAWHLLRNNEVDFFTRSARIGATVAMVLAILSPIQGHMHGVTMAKIQPAKMAAMEAHWNTSSNAPIYVLTWPDEENGRNYFESIKLPGLLSFVAFGDSQAEVIGLNDIPKDERPPVLLTFISFRIMIGLGGIFIVMGVLGFIFRNSLGQRPIISKLLTWLIPFPYLGIMAGWALAEIGRQPWIVHGLLKTNDAVSPIPSSSVWISLTAFIIVYTLLGIVDIYLLRKFARKGPDPIPGSKQNQAQSAGGEQYVWS